MKRTSATLVTALFLVTAGYGLPWCVQAETGAQTFPPNSPSNTPQENERARAFDDEGIAHAVRKMITFTLLSEQFEKNIVLCPMEERNAIAHQLSLKKTYVEMLMAPMTEADMDAFDKEFQRQNPKLFLFLAPKADPPVENQ